MASSTETHHHSEGAPLEIFPMRPIAPRISDEGTTTHRRLVIPRGENGSVEIVWESLSVARDDDDDDAATQRIAICSGPDDDAVARQTIVTMRLPPETLLPPPTNESVMVLTQLHQHPNVLCCLIHPHAMLLLDIFPNPHTPALIPAEGWTIPLPFACHGLFALPDGLLLHRCPEHNIDSETTSSSHWKHQFQHQVPAPPFASATQPPPLLLPRNTTPSTIHPNNPVSLFSFHHPLEEILPVAVADHQHDAIQRILWTGEDILVALGAAGALIYRIEVRSAAPLQSQPLYRSIQERYDTTPQQGGDAAVLVWDAAAMDTTDAVLFHQQPSTVTRDEALADALGVSPMHSTLHGVSHHRPSYSPPSGDGAAAADLTQHSIAFHNPPLRPRVHVTLLQSDAELPSEIQHVFLLPSGAEEEERILAMQHDKGALHLYILSHDRVVPIATIPSRSAQPLHTPVCNHLLVVLDPHQQLHLYRAGQLVAPLLIPVQSEITRVADATGCHCTVHTADPGTASSYRIALSLQHHEQLLMALSTAAGLPVQLVLSIRLALCYASSTPRAVLPRVARRLLLGAEDDRGTTVPANDTRSNSAWEQLLAASSEQPRPSPFHWTFPVDDQQQDATGLFAPFFDALHLLYEEHTVAGAADEAEELLDSLVECLAIYEAAHPGTERGMLYLDYYKRKAGAKWVEQQLGLVNRSSIPQSNRQDVVLSSFNTPPSLIAWMEEATANISSSSDNPYHTLDRSIHECDAFPTTRILLRIFRSHDIHQLFLDLLQEGFASPVDVVQRLPPCAALPMLDRMASIAIDQQWSASAWKLVGRPDLAANVEAAVVAPTQPSHAAYDASDRDGLKALEKASAMLFPDDNRVREAAKLLCSSRPISLRVDRPIEVSDHDYERLKQKKLSLNVFRSLALPIGRGMLTLGSIPCPQATKQLPMPEISVKGKVPPSNGTISLDMNDCPSDFLVWPYFHNGVAAGLRIPAASEQTGSDFKVTRTWIRFNRPVEYPEQDGEGNIDRILQGHANAGFLLALGLRGNLASLEMSDIYEYLTEGAITTTVGLVLGIAANKRGSCDIAVSKMISLHIPSLIPQHFSAIDVASPVQTAAVTASGLLFQSSSHRMMTEFLLNEIGKRPDTDVSTVDREAYSLACGLALGTVNLCHGKVDGISDRAAGLADLRIEERLIRYIVGGVDPDEERRKQESNDRFSLRSGVAVGDNERCSTVYEGPEINSVMCAPGSILALGLMYMKTENQSVASALALPETHFLLEFVRPDFLGLRVIARSVILWNEVQPSKEWLDSQIPRVVLDARDDIRDRAESAAYGEEANRSHEYDPTAVRRMYVHVVAGACFGMGLRYAGTANEEAKDTIMGTIFTLQDLREARDHVMAALRPEASILDSCLGAASISLAMVMAGTGDIECLRLFRVLRWRCEPDSRFGIHMIFGMSIGLLFLGGCTYTLGREPADIAALITAFFPVFPVTAPENHYHLQAVRHLYVLAVKKRLLRAIDVDTNQDVHVPIEVRADSSSLQLQAPVLLPYAEEPWKQLVLRTEKYYPLSIDLRHVAGVFYVKRRHKRLECTTSRASNIQDLVTAATDSALLQAFASYVLSGKSPVASPKSRALIAALSSTDETILFYLKLMYASDRYKAWNLRVMRANTTAQLAGLPAMVSTLQEHLDRRIEALYETDPDAAELLFQDCYV